MFRNVFTASPATLQFFPFRDEPNLYESKALKAHGAAVINTIGTAVVGLRDLDAMIPTLEKLGRMHIGMGIAHAHFDVLGAELLRTLGTCILLFFILSYFSSTPFIEMTLGDKFTPEVREAWGNMYHLVSSTMQNAMH